ncbi:chromate resistance protein [Limobrevibacterium gyesilva]|uniref:Chromate resistance protein n=1 Tax=Limobrevibacterium gyesilva TaxID=2991712 RepID=A0AA41YSP4_9PROT|nr:chromate resistance protein [Limobrevibacterium gyesilva]MCW3477847.1 chromate resistance protein [Limobrevibacterium gyesilva]
MTKWVTRERPKIDRIACPWLIRRFIEPEAEFIYVPTDRVFAVAKETGATPYDIPGAEPFAHDGEFCSFDAFLKRYDLKDPALQKLALIVRGADTARHDLAPQASGLHAISMGLSANIPDDHAMLEQDMVIYDALYTWCRDFQQEVHNWTPSTASPTRAQERVP